MVRLAPITTEDLAGLDFTNRPLEVEITKFCGRRVESLSPNAVPVTALRAIERAICDRGFRFGVVSAVVSVRRELRTVNGRQIPTTHMVAKLIYRRAAGC